MHLSIWRRSSRSPITGAVVRVRIIVISHQTAMKAWS